jgi:hypothetical protein
MITRALWLHDLTRPGKPRSDSLAFSLVTMVTMKGSGLMSGDGKQQLGRILLQRKAVSARDLKTALAQQKRSLTPVPLASQLVDHGKVEQDDALLALSQQSGVPAVDLAQSVIVLAHLDVVPRAAAEALRVLPISVDAEAVVLAMIDPTDRRAIDEIEFATGKTVRPRVALHTSLVAAIAAAYDARARGERHYRGPKAPACEGQPASEARLKPGR